MPRRHTSTPEREFGAPSPARLDSALRKDQVIIFRATKDDKMEIQATARGFRLTVTEYLLRLHQLVAQRMAGPKR